MCSEDGSRTHQPLLVMDDVQASYGDFKALFNITRTSTPGRL
jgi:hypothetical protein